MFDWLDTRASGVLLHPTSLPGDTGIGSMNPHLRRFLDFLQTSGFSYWQVCPLGPTGYGDSPYQSFSTFAGNPYLIDLHQLVGAGLLHDADLVALQVLEGARVDFGKLYERFWPILETAWERFQANRTLLPAEWGDFEQFKQDKADWLEGYALFMALKEKFGGKPWLEWPTQYRSFDSAQDNKAAEGIEDRVEAQMFYQFLFFSQWDAVREMARQRGISIIGDVPIFVALDSADVWSDPELFQLGRDGKPKAVAGVPPDYFAPKGQLWGNPLFDWKRMEKDGYAWWIRRMEAAASLYDVIRIDHFRGFQDYWSVPASHKDASKGKWMPGPGIDFFAKLKSALPGLKMIAEDLGVITDDVRKLRDESGLPGMAVLQFAFGGGADNLYLPHNLSQNCVIYPGTHDNDTTIGWYQGTTDSVRHHVRQYFRVSGQEINWDFIRSAYSSTARLAIIPMQDLMNLGAEARFNTPGVAEGNWQWRYLSDQLDQLWRQSSGYLLDLARLYGRDGVNPD